MTGRFPPETENPAPEIESELIVTAAVPLEVNVTDFVTAVPTETFPNASDVELSVTAGTAAFSCSAKLFDDEFALAVRLAVCVVLTEATVAVNDAVLAPEVTVTLPGTVTELELLASATPRVDVAAELSVTVQDVDAAPVKELPAHDSALTEGVMLDDVEAFNWMFVLAVTDPCEPVSLTV